jgi:hypothetical protein
VLKTLLTKLSPPIAELLGELPPAELFRELMRVAPMDEVEHLTSLSKDTLQREHGHLIVHLSARRTGMRVGDALMIGGARRTRT